MKNGQDFFLSVFFVFSVKNVSGGRNAAGQSNSTTVIPVPPN